MLVPHEPVLAAEPVSPGSLSPSQALSRTGVVLPEPAQRIARAELLRVGEAAAQAWRGVGAPGAARDGRVQRAPLTV